MILFAAYFATDDAMVKMESAADEDGILVANIDIDGEAREMAQGKW